MATAATMKQIAAGIIPGPITISPPYPERWKKYNHDIKADKMLANAPCLVALFQYNAAKTTGNKAENPLKHQIARSKTLASFAHIANA